MNFYTILSVLARQIVWQHDDYITEVLFLISHLKYQQQTYANIVQLHTPLSKYTLSVMTCPETELWPLKTKQKLSTCLAKSVKLV